MYLLEKQYKSRHVGKGLALLIIGKRIGFKRLNLIVYSDWYYNTTFALTVNCISWYKMKGGVHSLLKTKMVEAVWVASTIYDNCIFSKAIDYVTNASSSFVRESFAPYNE